MLIKKPTRYFTGLLLMLLTFSSCATQKEISVLYVNSYHQGYPMSDEVKEAIEKEFSAKNIELETYYLDSKNHSSEDEIKEKANEALLVAREMNPDVIILSDDNAVKYFGKAFNDSIIKPFVFCGVNWDHRSYDLPVNQFTGILEILPVRESIVYLKQSWPDASRLGILSENTNSERKNQVYLNTFTGMENIYRLADDFEQWKEMFIELSETCDFLFLPTNGAIKGWKDEEAASFVKENIRIPVFTCDDFMMKYCAFGMTKIASEQGEWAAKTAWMIINGKNIEDIPVAKNKEFESWYNPEIAAKIKFKPVDLKDIKIFPDDYNE